MKQGIKVYMYATRRQREKSIFHHLEMKYMYRIKGCMKALVSEIFVLLVFSSFHKSIFTHIAHKQKIVACGNGPLPEYSLCFIISFKI